MPTRQEIAEYIWANAASRGVDPGLALGIAGGEGLVDRTINSPYFGNPDSDGYSYGPYQLFSRSSDSGTIKSGGLAYEFMQKTGSAPSADNWKQQVDFSLDYMKSNGTSAWYSVRDAGGKAAITGKGNALAAKLGLGKSGTVQPLFSGDSLVTRSYEGGKRTAEEVENAPWNAAKVGGDIASPSSQNLTQATDKQTEQQSMSAYQQAQAIIQAAASQAQTDAASTQATLQSQGGWLAQTQGWLGNWVVRTFIVLLGLIFIGGALALIVFKGDPKAVIGSLGGK